MTLRHLIFLVLFYLGGGIFTSFGCLKQKEIGPGYFRLHGFGLGVLLFIVYLLLGKTNLDSAATLWFGLFVACVFGFSLLSGVSNKISTACFFLGVISFFGTVFLDTEQFILGGEYSLLLCNSILASLVLGFSMAAMMLGHWYLIQPTLSIKELKRITFLMIVFLVIRWGFASWKLFGIVEGLTELDIYRYFMKVPGVFVLMRYVWGLLGALILSILVWRTLSIRSTQSATGILYVVVVACLVGEILSVYLAFYFGMPI